ncbi:MAG: HAD family hydrolase [Bacillota bacterium]
MRVNIPSRGELELKAAVFDYNGTLANGGQLVEGVLDRLVMLSRTMDVYVITADTFGTVRQTLADFPVQVVVLSVEPGGPAKEKFVLSLGASYVAAFGNGANDALMLKAAGLGVVVLGDEGAAVETLVNADIAVRTITEGIDLLLDPRRLVATLRR